MQEYTKNMEEKTYYTWEAPEYEKKDTTPDWFWAVGIITVVICIFAILAKNYLLSVLIVLGVGCIMYLKIRSPKHITISITDRYIKIKEDERYYQDIQAFWIQIPKEKNKKHQLLLTMKRNLTPLLVITLPPEINTENLRQYMLKHIEEREMLNPPIYDMMEKLGF
jgi:predicted small secreted protein